MDDVVCAEIPDESDPELQKIILERYIHGPCGDDNPNCPCMQDGKCIHEYPKQFSNHSRLNKSGYPVYRRRQGKEYQVGQHMVDNRWVVPYNRFLAKKYNAHINVELCSSVKSVKYVYKYIYKGHDAASLRLTAEGNVLDYNEIDQYLEARYVGSPEACWRILKFPMQFRSHTIIRLAVHLDEEQSVVFEPGKEDEAVDRATERFTTLTSYFEVNREREGTPLNPNDADDPRNYAYMDMPAHLVFSDSRKGWVKRQRSRKPEIGRMFFVSPKDVERFHMRLLLLHTKGATSFAALRTVNGNVCPTYKEACQALGLAELDTELHETLDETVRMYSPETIRQVFGDILSMCNPTDSIELWEKYKDSMSEDFRRAGMTEQEADSTCYHQLKNITFRHLDITTIIPVPPTPPVPLPSETEEFYASEARLAGIDMYSSLNDDQKKAADGILQALNDPDAPKVFFLDGPGGSGKTYLYKTLCLMFEGMRKRVLNVAWSGIAAQLLSEGRTAHSAFTLPVPVTEDKFMPSMRLNSAQANALRDLDVIVWDEAPTSPKYAIEGVSLLLQDIMGNKKPFGGKLMLFGGDFRQIPPIVKEKHFTAVLEATIKRSHLWKHFVQYKLSVNMRATDSEPFFKDFLMRVGNGTEITDDKGTISIPECCCSDGDLVSEIYGSTLTNLMPEDLAERAILCLKNSDCDEMNDKVLDLLPGADKVYYSIDEAVSDEPDAQYPMEFINGLTPSGMPKHELRLRVGSAVMLLRISMLRKVYATAPVLLFSA